MRNLTLITLLLLFCTLYSAISRVLDSCNNNSRSIEIVSEKNEKEGFELYIKLPPSLNSAPSCLNCKYPNPLKSNQRLNSFSPGFFQQDIFFTDLNTCKNRQNKQLDLLEMHNTREITIGYFMML